jgi:hypothetical protein
MIQLQPGGQSRNDLRLSCCFVNYFDHDCHALPHQSLMLTLFFSGLPAPGKALRAGDGFAPTNMYILNGFNTVILQVIFFSRFFLFFLGASGRLESKGKKQDNF